MKKILFFTIALCLVAGTALAKDTTGRLGIGFTYSQTPVGARYWVNDKVGVDAGFGIKTRDDGNLTDFAFSGGVPIVLMNDADRVNFLVRPGVLYTSTDTNTQDYSAATDLMLSATLEFEVFLTDDFSASASHGFAISIMDDGSPNSSSTTDYGTFGNNLTEFGFHYYFKAKQ
jgi:hypothetical protein